MARARRRRRKRKLKDKYIVKKRRIARSETGAIRVTAEVWHLGEKVFDYDRGGAIQPGTTNDELNQAIVNTAIRETERRQVEEARQKALEATLAELTKQDEFEVPIYEEPEGPEGPEEPEELEPEAEAEAEVTEVVEGTTATETAPADTTPADITPADTTPADTTPAEEAPADETPAGA